MPEVIYKFAQAIKRATAIREESYDLAAADKESKSKPGKVGYYIDFSTFYRKTMKQAVEEALAEEGLDPRWCEPLYLLINYSWNDICDWSEIISPS